jgi:hypothetical protein
VETLGAKGSGLGASLPLPRVAAIVFFLNPQPAFSRVDGNRSSCPKPVIQRDAEEQAAKPVFKDPTISALETGHPIDTAPPVGRADEIDPHRSAKSAAIPGRR